MEGYDKVTNSWANDIDKLSQNLKNVKLSLGDNFANILQPAIKTINESFKEGGKLSAEGKASLGVFADTLSTITVLSVLNLGKMRAGFTALSTSMKGLMASPYGLAFIAGTAIAGAMVRYATAQAEESEAMAEKALQNAKSWEELNKKTKQTKQRFYDLKNEMRQLGTEQLTSKVKDLSEAFKETITSSLDLKDVIKALSDNKVILSLSFDEKAFDNEEKRIIERTSYFNKTLEDLKNNKKNKSDFIVSGENRSNRTDMEKAFNERLNIKNIQSTKMGSWGRLEGSVPAIEELSLFTKEIDAQMKKVNELTDAVLRNRKAWITVAGQGNPEYEKYRGLGSVDKAKMAKDKGWTFIDISRMEKEYNEYKKNSEKFSKEDRRIKDEIHPVIKELSRYGIDASGIWKDLQSNIEALTKNEADRLEQRKLYMEAIANSLELASEKINKISLEQAQLFMKKSNFKSLEDFKSGLDKVGLSSYKTLIKDFGNVINSFASESSKMEFMANEFLGMASSVEALNKQLSDLGDQNVWSESAIAVLKDGTEATAKNIYTGANLTDKQGKNIPLTAGALYKSLDLMKGGVTGELALKELQNYDEATRDNISNIYKYTKVAKDYKKTIQDIQKNAGIPKTTIETLDGYNNGLNVEVEKLKKVNASKLKGYEIDLKVAELQHKIFQDSQKVKIDTKKETINKEFGKYIKDGTIDISKVSGLSNISKLVQTKEININDYKSIGNFISEIGATKQLS